MFFDFIIKHDGETHKVEQQIDAESAVEEFAETHDIDMGDTVEVVDHGMYEVGFKYYEITQVEAVR